MPEQDIDEKEIQAKFGDRKWRLNHLYFIKDANGKKVQFKMNPVQEYLHDHLWFRNIIPKARKLGVSTFFSILNLDQIIFSENKTAGIIAHRQEDQKRLFRNNIQFAVEQLHPWLKQIVGKPEISSANELVFKNGGTIFVSLTTRGQTPNYLHVSEYGYICKHSPDKAEEILSGAINSVAIGNMVSIESTAEGKNGHFYDLCMAAERKRVTGEQLTPLDFKMFFFPWYLDPQYALNEADWVTIPKDFEEYFAQLKRMENIKLTDGQKRWYVKMAETNQDHRFSQFPSTLDEAFSVSLEGAYYGKYVNAVYAENRVGFFPIDPTYPVDTAWDLGINDSTAVVFFQSIGPEIRFVDFYESSNVGLEHYANVLRTKGYRYGKHILPHDVNVRDLSTGVARINMLYELGLQNIIVAPKIFIADGIEKVRLLFPRFRFDKSKAAPVLDALQTYRKQWDDGKGTWSDSPFHGPESHVADAVRTLAVVWHEQMGGSDKLVDAWGNPVQSNDVRIESFFG